MCFGDNGGRSKNYEPNSFDGPRQTDEPHYAGLAGEGVSGTYAPVHHAEDDDFVQAGMLYRVMPEDARERLVANIAGNLGRVSRPEIIERSIGHFRDADPEYGARVEAAVKAQRG
jgi:catalase